PDPGILSREEEALPKKCRTGCQPVLESAEIEIWATTSAGWQPAVHFLGKAGGRSLFSLQTGVSHGERSLSFLLRKKCSLARKQFFLLGEQSIWLGKQFFLHSKSKR